MAGQAGEVLFETGADNLVELGNKLVQVASRIIQIGNLGHQLGVTGLDLGIFGGRVADLRLAGIKFVFQLGQLLLQAAR